MANSETSLQARLWKTLSQSPDVRLWRNNVGTCKAADGRFVRFGLCPGSSDLIGLTRVTITPDMVGQTIALFTAIEVKTPTGRVTPEQQSFIDFVQRSGGRAGVARSMQDANKIISGEGHV
ncbi:VRR-NUC domain-containing protein [Synechococcus elongatus]|uniref:VRR-NUC domain-containing protein n=2 Tax=Synechococcus elongatus TaxID=32046 RepID=Q31QB1_SYNE7|nr:VRR-NUC domain-containing protein [Synechococcus elongatus]ABB56758.1 conserved hypothetical protein [Synechococcus elongatus PCC 7942 = FACHB-805]AJD58702.1 hypothetical protein M744_13120 [Synechococcus elongatus UTEX 2973]MBD2588620.1 VRR-NUC domain-containing protein [Synechococcus elongatus FACHB-242]MBD2689791.1 VRR-NUC domain-containing protein [Synechococcus elongatus FACHB-1061]MBD2708398.1 VRR-NUC domain-containing protein [Synechococcus elongatus PCC 7942 = FACHB-805]